MTYTSDLPPEFDLPPAVAERHVRLLEAAMNPPGRQSRRPRLRALAIAAAVFAALATVAAAATMGLLDRDVTRADIDARLTMTTRTTQECNAAGDCAPPRTETIGVIKVVPADGITFVDPDGYLGTLVPALGVFGFQSASELSLELARSRSEQGGIERATLALPDGGERSFSWVRGEGTLTVTDVFGDGSKATTVLRSGDVVPLVPGSLDNQPLTPDKAVTFDLAYGDYQVWIYPQRNEAYAVDPPWRSSDRKTSVPAPLLGRYGLEPRAGGLTVPVDAAGGSWTYRLDDDTTRTVAWRGGDTAVTVTDRDADGDVLGRETVEVGRRVHAG